MSIFVFVDQIIQALKDICHTYPFVGFFKARVNDLFYTRKVLELSCGGILVCVYLPYQNHWVYNIIPNTSPCIQFKDYTSKSIYIHISLGSFSTQRFLMLIHHSTSICPWFGVGHRRCTESTDTEITDDCMVCPLFDLYRIHQKIKFMRGLATRVEDN